MKKRHVIALCAVLAIGLISLVSYAQDEPEKSQGYLIWEDHVIPAKAPAYEEAVKLHMGNFADQEFPYTINVFSADGYIYYWTVAIDKFADIDTLYKKLGKVFKNTDEGISDKIDEAYAGTYTHSKPWTCLWLKDFSYMPESSATASDETHDFRSWGFCYVEMGKQDELRAVFTKWVELSRSKNISRGFNFYQGDVGTDMPFVFWSISDKNSLEFHKNDEVIREALGEEGGELWKETEALLRGFEPVKGWYRNDLSYNPSEE